ncbi:MAG: acylphosphatase [Verrucomicrobiales bacterium]|jgi:acylphosphatase
MIAKSAIFAGRVQGVGFRFSTKQIAKGFDVIGWVKNLSNGKVEVQVKGEAEEVDEFFLEIREGSSLAQHVQEFEEDEIPLEQLDDVTGFTIVR